MRALFAAPLGADFWKLWTSSAVSNLGGGVTMVAGPPLVASINPDPALVALAAFAQQLPWLLFALFSGAWADRLDRRRLVVTVNLIQAAAAPPSRRVFGQLSAEIGEGLRFLFHRPRYSVA